VPFATKIIKKAVFKKGKKQQRKRTETILRNSSIFDKKHPTTATRYDPRWAPLMLILPDLPLSGSDCGWASIGVLREIRSDADSLAWWARLSRDDDRWSRVPLAPIFSISFWPRLLRVRLRRENVFSRFPFFLSSLVSSLSDSMDVLLLLPLRDDAEDATLPPAEKEEFPPTSSARSWATLVWRTTSMAWGSKEEFSLPQPKLWEKF